MKELRVALIGRGPWAQKIAQSIGGMEFVDRLRASTAGSPSPSLSLELHSGRDWDLDGSTANAAVVAVDPRATLEVSQALLERGLPVLAEKPLSTSWTELGHFQQWYRALKNPPPFGVNYLYRHHPGLARLRVQIRREVKQGILGLAKIQTFFAQQGPDRPGVAPWWDYAVHDLAAVCSLLSPIAGDLEPETVGYPWGGPTLKPWGDNSDDEFPNGNYQLNWRVPLPRGGYVPVVSHFGNRMPDRMREIQLHFFGGRIFTWTEYANGDCRIHDRPMDGEVYSYRSGRPYPSVLTRALVAFAQKVSRGENGLQDLQLTKAITMALSEAEKTL